MSLIFWLVNTEDQWFSENRKQQNTTGSPQIWILLAYPTWTQHGSSLFILDLAHAMVCEESTQEIVNASNFFFPLYQTNQTKTTTITKSSSLFAFLLLNYSKQEHFISALSLTVSFQICFLREQMLACKQPHQLPLNFLSLDDSKHVLMAPPSLQ